MNLTADIVYLGVNDHVTDLFEGQYPVPNGMAYNSYLILDEKTAVLDTVDARFSEEWLAKVADALGERRPDYLIVQHMEPDHSAGIMEFLTLYPDAKVVANARTFDMIRGFFGTDLEGRRVTVADGGTLELGKHVLHFVFAPMVHWPEVMFTYDSTDKVLFSADAFGKFGALDADEPWDGEARRYYIGIVGKYGAQVQAVLKKAAALDIRTVCPLHGPVLTGDLGHYLALYDTWSAYRPEEDGVVVACASVYGHTMAAAELLARELRARGQKAAFYDLCRADLSLVTAEAFRYSKLALASITYNGDVFPPMKEFLHHLTERGFRGRTVGLVENGSWAPQAARIMKAALEPCKDLTWAEPPVTVRSALTEENRAQIAALAESLAH